MSLLSDLINSNYSDVSGKIIAEYVWIGGSGLDLRSKARTLSAPVSDPSKLPKWNYYGPSTGQAPREDSEVIIYPQAIYPDPFRRGNHILTVSDSVTDQSKLNYDESSSDQAARKVSQVIINGQNDRSKSNGHARARRKRTKKKRKHNKAWNKN